MKKAVLVTFEVSTRLIVDADFDNVASFSLDWEIARIAADKIKSNPDSYINEENLAEVDYDSEMPYDPDYDKVDLHIPTTQEMIDFIRTNSKCNKSIVNGVLIELPTTELLLEEPIKLDKTTSVDLIMETKDHRVKIHYDNAELESIGVSYVDWDDITIETKLKILKAIEYED